MVVDAVSAIGSHRCCENFPTPALELASRERGAERGAEREREAERKTEAKGEESRTLFVDVLRFLHNVQLFILYKIMALFCDISIAVTVRSVSFSSFLTRFTLLSLLQFSLICLASIFKGMKFWLL